MSTDLVLRHNDHHHGLDLNTLGTVLAKSGYFADTKDAAQAIVKVIAGQELGIGPIAAMTGVYIVNGRVAIGANLMAAAVKRSDKYNYRVAEMTDKVCRIIFLEGGQEVGESAFSIEDAKRAGTKNIDKFPRNMLFARALSNGVRWFCPDVFDATVYTPDELRGDMSDDNRSMVVEPTPTPPRPAAPRADPATGEVIEAPERDLSAVRDLVAKIRAAGGDPGSITPRQMREMDAATFDAYLNGMREMLAALDGATLMPEGPYDQAAATNPEWHKA